MSKNQIKLTICAMCGKSFVKQVGSIYHVEYQGRVNQCCSYTCYMKAKRLKEKLTDKQAHEYN